MSENKNTRYQNSLADNAVFEEDNYSDEKLNLEKKYRRMTFVLISIIVFVIGFGVMSGIKSKSDNIHVEDVVIEESQKTTAITPTQKPQNQLKTDFGTYDNDDEIFNLSATASSELNQKGTVYSASYVLDGDEWTNWQFTLEDAEQEQLVKNVNEHLTLKLSQPEKVKYISVRAGFCGDQTGYDWNGRPTKIKVSFSDGSSFVVDLRQDIDYQTFKLTEPILTDSVQITVLEAFTGSRYPEIAISDVKLYR